jgi:hypothetical protein
MICHRCKEQIAVGEACITEPLEWGKYHYYHTGCRQQQEPRREPITRQDARRMLGPYPNERR